MPNETSGERLLARRYRLGTQVGRGGMGTVWQAHDEVLGRDVAVKEVILPHGLTDEERDVQYKRTFREARTAARLGHPGVVTVYDVVEEDGRPWIIMELIHARSLDQIIKKDGPLDVRRAADVGRQMLAALHAAHDAGVLHRDVKPSNVLVTRGERAVLTDFGIATSAGDATLTQTGLVMGSPAYIAPERARGRTAGPASDLWSLGVTLYAMTHGRSPFERSEPMAALVAVISEEPDPADAAGPLAPVIEGLLRKDPARRMDAIEAGALLDAIVRQESADSQSTQVVDAPADTATDVPEPLAPDGGVPDGTRAEYIPARTDHDEHDEQRSAFGAMSRRPPRGTLPAGAPPPRERGPAANRNAIVAGVIVVLLVLVVVVFAIAASGDEREPSGTGTRSPAPTKASGSPSASATPTATSSPSPTVPAGFRVYEDPNGFSVPIPEGWSGPSRRSSSPSSVFFEPPDGPGYIQIDRTSEPGPSALDDWQRYEPQARGNFDGYRLVGIAPVASGEPVSDPTGAKAADWEWTYDGSGGRLHALNRGFVMNDTGYAIVLVAPDDGWDATLARMDPVYRFFEPED